MFTLIGLAITAAATFFGFAAARKFTRDRLRFVDAAQNGIFPVVVGVGVALLAAIPVGLLNAIPIVTWVVSGGLPLFLGLGVGAGTAVGIADIRRRRLTP